jgi:predicted nucleic acid-binding protein
MMVVDASAVAEVVLGFSGSAALSSRLFEPGQTLHAPHLLDVEVAHVIRRYAFIGDIDDDRGRRAIDNLVDFPIRRYPHDALLPRVWDLRGHISASDAVYVALAEALEAPLLTRDGRLAEAVQRFTRVQLV